MADHKELSLVTMNATKQTQREKLKDLFTNFSQTQFAKQ